MDRQSIRIDGVAAKVEFRCTKGHPTIWTSCEQIGRQALMLNRLVPCAAVMTGLKLTPTKRFLGLLQVETQGSSYMKSSAVEILVRLTNQMYLEEIDRVREEMMESDTFDLGMSRFYWLNLSLLFLFYYHVYRSSLLFSCHPFNSYFVAMDEQHSRSQRKFGAAPFCTATFLNGDSLICEMTNVDNDAATKTNVTTKAGTIAKSKAKIAHVEGMKAIAEAFKESESSLVHFCADQSSDGMTDADLYLRPHWDFRACYDIWHKVKEFSGLWKNYCSKRTCPRGMSILK